MEGPSVQDSSSREGPRSVGNAEGRMKNTEEKKRIPCCVLGASGEIVTILGRTPSGHQASKP